jgi:hypothetical protein
MKNYQKQAQDFLTTTNTEMQIRFIEFAPYFDKK